MYPDLYRLDTLSDENALKEEDENGAELLIPQPDRLQLSFEKITAIGNWIYFFISITSTGLKNFFWTFAGCHKVCFNF